MGVWSVFWDEEKVGEGILSPGREVSHEASESAGASSCLFLEGFSLTGVDSPLSLDSEWSIGSDDVFELPVEESVRESSNEAALLGEDQVLIQVPVEEIRGGSNVLSSLIEPALIGGFL